MQIQTSKTWFKQSKSYVRTLAKVRMYLPTSLSTSIKDTSAATGIYCMYLHVACYPLDVRWYFPVAWGPHRAGLLDIKLRPKPLSFSPGVENREYFIKLKIRKSIHSLFCFLGTNSPFFTVAKSALRLDTRVTVHATYIFWEHCNWQTLKPKPTALPTQSFQSAISLWSQLLEVAMKANCLSKSSGSSPVRMQLQKQSEIFWPWSELSTYHTKRDQNKQTGDVHSHAKSLYDSQPKTSNICV